MTSLPSPRTPDPMDAPPLRWGILGTGWIAAQFVGALGSGTRQVVTAVGSRTTERAAGFAAGHGLDARVHGSYAALVADPAVDIVYIASPHSEHHEHALLALRAGKSVLVEKAFTRSAAEARDVVETASAAGLFAMEAMWTRFLPHIDVVRQVLAGGLLGDVLSVRADHGQRLYPDGPARLARPELAGGALLDLGVYPMSFAHFVLGSFTSVTAVGRLTDEGVDAAEVLAVTGPRGELAVLDATMLVKTPTTAVISGTRARLELDGDFYAPTTMRLLAPEGDVLATYEPPVHDGHLSLRFEVAEAARCVAAGRTESPLLPLAETVAIMEALDRARRQLGVRYPGE